jgi:hypothetical protein
MQVKHHSITEIILKPCNAVQLAKAYGVSKKILVKWLQPYQRHIGSRCGHKFSIEQLLIIIEVIGMPVYSID